MTTAYVTASTGSQRGAVVPLPGVAYSDLEGRLAHVTVPSQGHRPATPLAVGYSDEAVAAAGVRHLIYQRTHQPSLNTSNGWNQLLAELAPHSDLLGRALSYVARLSPDTLRTESVKYGITEGLTLDHSTIHLLSTSLSPVPLIGDDVRSSVKLIDVALRLYIQDQVQRREQYGGNIMPGAQRLYAA